MSKITLILVGYGNMGKDWGKVIYKFDQVEVIGVVDILGKNRNQARSDFGLKSSHISDKLDLLVSALKPTAIIDCSIPAAHFQNTLIALKYSCHVLGEKPIALKYKDAEKVVELSRRKKLVYMVNQNYRRNPVLKILQNKISEIGRIYSVNIDYFQGLEFNDTFRYSFHHPLLFDMAIHHFDMARMISGQNAKYVFAAEYNPTTSKFINGSTAFAHFKMNNETILSYRGSWSSVGFNTSYNGNWNIVGEFGTIMWNGDLDLSLEKRTQDNHIVVEKVSLPQEFQLKPYELFLYELRQNLELFIKSISNSTLPDCWCGDNINSLAMVLSAIKSSETNQALAVEN